MATAAYRLVPTGTPSVTATAAVLVGAARPELFEMVPVETDEYLGCREEEDGANGDAETEIQRLDLRLVEQLVVEYVHYVQDAVCLFDEKSK